MGNERAGLNRAGDSRISERMARPTNALIVDDEAHVRVFARMLLKEVGIATTWEAADGIAALEQINTHDPELVLLDVNLPQMTGIEVLKQINEARPELPVIIMSSESAIKTVRDALEFGAIAYILKHAGKNDALKSLRAAVDGLADSDESGADSTPA